MKTKEKNRINNVYNQVVLKSVELLKPSVYKIIKDISSETVSNQLASLATALQILSEIYGVEPVELLAITEGIVHSGVNNSMHLEWQKLRLLKKEMEN